MLLEVKESKLANGIRVATAAMPHVQSVALGIWIGVGGRYETRHLAGVSHFIEHLLFKGTEKLSARDISQAIEGCGGYCNAFTQEEGTCYFARVADDHTWKTLGILAEMYLHPRFAVEDIEKERGVIIEEIMMCRDQPEQVVHEMLGASLWKDHELGRPLVGTPETIRGLTRDQILSFKNKKYVSGNTVFVFAGKVKHAECVTRVERRLRHLRGGREPVCNLVTPSVAQARLTLRPKKIEQTQMALGFRLFGRFDRRRYALKVLNVILGENMSSRLFQVVREKHGLAYAVHSAVQLFAETGALVIGAGLDRARRDRALDLIFREIRRLKQEPVRPQELARAKEYIVGQLRLALESPGGQMMWVGEHILNFGASLPPEQIIAAIMAVRTDDLQELAKSIFRERTLSLALLSPGISGKDESRLETLARAL